LEGGGGLKLGQDFEFTAAIVHVVSSVARQIGNGCDDVAAASNPDADIPVHFVTPIGRHVKAPGHFFNVLVVGAISDAITHSIEFADIANKEVIGVFLREGFHGRKGRFFGG